MPTRFQITDALDSVHFSIHEQSHVEDEGIEANNSEKFVEKLVS